MAKLTKRQKATAGKVESTKLYPIEAALALVKECATAKFDESIDATGLATCVNWRTWWNVV